MQTDGGELLRFDTNGEKRYEDGSTWYLSNTPFAERTAERRKAGQKTDEEARQKACRRDEMLKTLVVGQRWFMLSEPYCNTGTVIEVAPDGVTVQLDVPGDPRGLHGLRPDMGTLVRFNMTGESLPDYGSEAGPWYLNHVRTTTSEN
jgi:hypothetical protein